MASYIGLGSGLATPTPVHPYQISGTVLVGDVVYLTASMTVARADADNAGARPPIGVVISVTGNTARVAGAGSVVAGMTGLTAGSVYWLSTSPGQITSTQPSTNAYVIGTAISATSLLVGTVPVDLASSGGGGGGGATDLGQLTDTTITSPASGDVLAYDGSSWINFNSLDLNYGVTVEGGFVFALRAEELYRVTLGVDAYVWDVLSLADREVTITPSGVWEASGVTVYILDGGTFQPIDTEFVLLGNATVNYTVPGTGSFILYFVNNSAETDIKAFTVTTGNPTYSGIKLSRVDDLTYYPNNTPGATRFIGYQPASPPIPESFFVADLPTTQTDVISGTGIGNFPGQDVTFNFSEVTVGAITYNANYVSLVPGAIDNATDFEFVLFIQHGQSFLATNSTFTAGIQILDDTDTLLDTVYPKEFGLDPLTNLGGLLKLQVQKRPIGGWIGTLTLTGGIYDQPFNSLLNGVVNPVTTRFVFNILLNVNYRIRPFFIVTHTNGSAGYVSFRAAYTRIKY